MPQSHLSLAPISKRRSQLQVARNVRGVHPYQAVSSLDTIRARPEQLPHKLDWNEATVPPSPKVQEAIMAFLESSNHLNWYPVLNSMNLAAALNHFYGVPQESFLVTNGSDDALNTICTTYLDPGDRVLVASPSYQHFLVFAQTRGAEIIHHYAPDPFEKDIEGLLRALHHHRPRLIYLVNPNNPTGVSYTPAEVAHLLAASPESLFVLDEAYYEFAGVTSIGLLSTHSNLVITRTFSKAYGMAGLRVGYALASPDIIEDLKRVFNPKSVNVLAQIGAIAALKDQVYLRSYLDEVARAKELMASWCASHGLPLHSTPGNYVMIRFEQAPWVVHLLHEEGVYVRDRSQMPQLSGYVRFSVGTLEQTQDVLSRLERVLKHLPG